MYLIDTHCHLDDPVFDPDRETMLRSCLEKGVKQLIVPGVVASGWERLFRICGESADIYAAPGLHPCFISNHRTEQLTDLINLVRQFRNKVVAIGECGLDLYADGDEFEIQREFFSLQIEMAVQLNLPLILHGRKAHDQILKIIKEKKFTGGGTVHCYSGSLQQAERYLDFGFKLGIGGVVTYERSHKLHRTVSSLPLSAFVLETDAPDIPVSGRQKTRNSPEYLPEIFQAFLNHREESEEETMNQLYSNTLELFPALRK